MKTLLIAMVMSTSVWSQSMGTIDTIIPNGSNNYTVVVIYSSYNKAVDSTYYYWTTLTATIDSLDTTRHYAKYAFFYTSWQRPSVEYYLRTYLGNALVYDQRIPDSCIHQSPPSTDKEKYNPYPGIASVKVYHRIVKTRTINTGGRNYYDLLGRKVLSKRIDFQLLLRR